MEEFIQKYSPHLLGKKLYLPTHDEFISTYCSQPFSIPTSIIYYITKNPSNRRIYQKMIQCCKYFFIKNPILVIKSLGLHPDKLPKILYSTTSQLWITPSFYAHEPLQHLFSSIIPKIYYKSFINQLGLYGISLSLKDFAFLSSNARFISFDNVSIKYSSGNEVELEAIVEFCQNVKIFEYTFSANASNFSSETIKEIIKFPNVSKMSTFWLREIPDTFDIRPLIEFVKKTNLYVILRFADSISEEYRNHLNEIALEIVKNDSIFYRRPVLIIDDFDYEIETEIEKAVYSFN